MTFKNDLNYGMSFENKAISYYTNNGYELIKRSNGYFKFYDFIIKDKDDNILKIEVKADRYGSNLMCVEFEYKNKPSGINTTKADYYCYYSVKDLNERLFVIPVCVIKELINNKQYERIIKPRNNTSQCYLIPLEYVEKYKVNV